MSVTHTGSFSFSFKNEHIIYENMVKCTIKDHEMNYSYNPTLLVSGSSKDVKYFVTSSDFTPYATTLGMYNEANELLAVAKFGKPIPMSQNTDITFLIKYDL